MAAPKEEIKGDEAEELKQDEILIAVPDKTILDKLSQELRDTYNYKAKYKINNNGSVTFEPTPSEYCKLNNKGLITKRMSMKAAVKEAGCGKIEATSNTNVEIIQSGDESICSFIRAALKAWSDHYPFKFRVQHIWILILQSVAVHVDQNAEKLRKNFVTHDGKKELQVIRDDFVLGSDKNDWLGVIKEFVEQIDKNTVPDTADLFDCDFTSSTLMEQICTKVTIMDICKNYFKYLVSTRCGFPSITLDGTKNDWIKLKQKVIKLLDTKVDKDWGKQWGSALIPLLDRFIVAFDGNIDPVFWNSMIKRGAMGGSGGYNFYTGWFNILFPFLDKKNNPYCVPYTMDKEYVEQGFTLHRQCGWRDTAGGNVNKYPSGLAIAPVTWDYLGKELSLKFIAGFVGYTQDPKTMEICPHLGWCVAHQDDKSNKN